MLEVKCIDKKRDKSGKIIAYKLIDKQGVAKVMSAMELKQAIKGDKLCVVNLTLTKDGRLVSKSEEQGVSKSHLVPFKELTATQQQKAIQIAQEKQSALHNCIAANWYKDCVPELCYDKLQQLADDLRTVHNIVVNPRKIKWRFGHGNTVSGLIFDKAFSTYTGGTDDCKLELCFLASPATANAVDIRACAYVGDTEYPVSWRGSAHSRECDFSTKCDIVIKPTEGIRVMYKGRCRFEGFIHDKLLPKVIAKLCDDRDVHTAVREHCECYDGGYYFDDTPNGTADVLVEVLQNFLDDEGMSILVNEGNCIDIQLNKVYYKDAIVFKYRNRNMLEPVVYRGSYKNKVAFRRVITKLCTDASVRMCFRNWCMEINETERLITTTISDTPMMVADAFVRLITKHLDDVLLPRDYCFQETLYLTSSKVDLCFASEEDSEDRYFMLDIVPEAISKEVLKVGGTAQHFIDLALKEVANIYQQKLSADFIRDFLLEEDTFRFLVRGNDVKFYATICK